MTRISLLACAVVPTALLIPVAGAHSKDSKSDPRQKDVHHGQAAAYLDNAVRNR
jgi:hypothetical protein